MDFIFSEEDETFRREAVDFVERELPWDWRTEVVDAEEPADAVKVRQFKKRLADRGWLTMAWPPEYGGLGAPHIRQMVFNEEMAYRGVPASDAGVSMVGPILMLYGTEEQKRYFLPRIARADIDWAQGYTEPDAGSDLASVQTRAEEDGDDFVVTGSKIWNGAHGGSNWMFMLVRTDPDAPKHRGISFLLTEMDAPGITVERIPMMWNADRALVTLDKVRVPKRHLVGELNRGWYVGAALLDFERSGVGNSARGRRIVEELVQFCKENTRNGRPLSEDPLIRSRLASLAVEVETCRLMSYNVAWMQSRQMIPNKEASIVKAFGTEMVVRLYQLGMSILGLYGQLEPDSRWAPLKGRIENAYMVSAASMVAAGTSEIQRNIIATRGLGLPRG